MKTRIFSNIVILIIILLLSITAEAEDRFTISEIYEQYNGQRWQESYQTVRNETVTIDAPFIIPHVESAPVIRVGHYPSLEKKLRNNCFGRMLYNRFTLASK